METVSEIIEPVFKQGIGKTGKPWSIAKIVTNTGKSATCFNPVIVGQEVELEFNDQYKNWSAKVTDNNKQRSYPRQNDDVMEKTVNMVFESLKEINSKLDKLLGQDKVVEMPPEDQEISITDIPF